MSFIPWEIAGAVAVVVVVALVIAAVWNARREGKGNGTG